MRKILSARFFHQIKKSEKSSTKEKVKLLPPPEKKGLPT